jgi:hypothetical protein
MGHALAMVVLGINRKSDGSARYALVERTAAGLDVRDTGSESTLNDSSALRKLLNFYGTKNIAIALDEPASKITHAEIPPNLPAGKTAQYVRGRALKLGYLPVDVIRAVEYNSTWFCAAADATIVRDMRSLARSAKARITRMEHAPTASIRAYPRGSNIIVESLGDGLRVTLISALGYAQERALPYVQPMGAVETREVTLGRALDSLITEAESSGYINPGLPIYVAKDCPVQTRRNTIELSIAGHNDWQDYAAAIGTALGAAANDRGTPKCLLVDFNKAPTLDPLSWIEPYVASVPIEKIRIPLVLSGILLAATGLQVIDVYHTQGQTAAIAEALEKPEVVACMAAVNADANRYNAKVTLLTQYDQARYSSGSLALAVNNFLRAVPPDVRFQSVTEGNTTNVVGFARSQTSANMTFGVLGNAGADFDAKPTSGVIPFVISTTVAPNQNGANPVTIIPAEVGHCPDPTRQALLAKRLP